MTLSAGTEKRFRQGKKNLPKIRTPEGVKRDRCVERIIGQWISKIKGELEKAREQFPDSTAKIGFSEDFTIFLEFCCD